MVMAGSLAAITAYQATSVLAAMTRYHTTVMAVLIVQKIIC